MPERSSMTPTPRWRDPLFSAGDRFPLGPPRGYWEGGDDPPSGPTTRPFSLRGVVTGPPMDVDLSVHYGYCADRQTALVHSADGSTVPLLSHTRPGPTPVTSGFPDGQPGQAPPEEMSTPDYQSD